MRGILKVLGIFAVTVLLIFALVSKVSSPEPSTPAPAPAPVMSLTLYFATPDAAAIRAEKREVPKNSEPARIAMEELLAGSKSQDLITVIPAGTKLKGLAVKDRVAYVDVSDDILKTPHRGSASETLVVASIVNTLTGIEGIDKVQILIEGKEVETLYGHMDLSRPFSRFGEYSAAGTVVQAFRLKSAVSGI